MLLGAFQPPGPPRFFPGAENRELVSICPAPKSTYSAAIQARFTSAVPATCISVSCRMTRDHQVRTAERILLSGFGGRKTSGSLGKLSTAEVLRLRSGYLPVQFAAEKLPRASANRHRRGPSTPRHKALCHPTNPRSASLRMTALFGGLYETQFGRPRSTALGQTQRDSIV